MGLLGGPVGVAAGAALGAGTGILTDKDDIYLGEPVWDKWGGRRRPASPPCSLGEIGRRKALGSTRSAVLFKLGDERIDLGEALA